MNGSKEMVLVVDFGSHDTQTVARKIRDMGVYSEILPYHKADEMLSKNNVKGIVLSGVISTEELVHADNFRKSGLPIFEIASATFDRDVLESFVKDTCGCRVTWSASSFVIAAVEAIQKDVKDKKVLCGLSGGVDSAVTAALIHRAIGDNLTCVFVDTGLMRLNEGILVAKAFQNNLKAKLVVVDAADRFLSGLKDVTDPEKKRKVIGELYIRVFEEEAKKYGPFDFLAQGTVYPDVIESVAAKGMKSGIKSHHNVGGLPDKVDFQLLEPLRNLFKDEVRAVGKVLGLEDDLVHRHPFPGPGLAVRVLGEVTKERCDVLRFADHIALEELRKAGLYRDVWQAFCVLLPIKTVGVRKGERTYDNAIVLRVVNGVDGMTADWSRLPYELLGSISSRIIEEVPGINRVVYDISSKPPATIEWE